MELVIDGKRVVAGTGGREFDPALPGIVLLHGAGMDHTVWALQARFLAHHGRNVLALDLPGHGGSDGPALETIEALAQWVLVVCAALPLERFRLAGQSMGALVALEAAACAGERCEGLALLGFAPEMRVHPGLLAAARSGDHGAVELMTSWGIGARQQLGGNPAPGLWVVGGALRLLERAPAASLAADFAACDAYRGASAAAERLRCPTLFVLGRDDRMTPVAQGAAFAAGIPHARTEILPGVGHMMMIEDPTATLAAMKTVL